MVRVRVAMEIAARIGCDMGSFLGGGVITVRRMAKQGCDMREGISKAKLLTIGLAHTKALSSLGVAD